MPETNRTPRFAGTGFGDALCRQSQWAADARRRSGYAHRLDARFHGRQRAGCKQPSYACAVARRRGSRAREQRIHERIIHDHHVFKKAAVGQNSWCGGLNKVDAQNVRVSLRSCAAVDRAILVPDLNKAGSCVS